PHAGDPQRRYRPVPSVRSRQTADGAIQPPGGRSATGHGRRLSRGRITNHLWPRTDVGAGPQVFSGRGQPNGATQVYAPGFGANGSTAPIASIVSPLPRRTSTETGPSSARTSWNGHAIGPTRKSTAHCSLVPQVPVGKNVVRTSPWGVCRSSVT